MAEALLKKQSQQIVGGASAMTGVVSRSLCFRCIAGILCCRACRKKESKPPQEEADETKQKLAEEQRRREIEEAENLKSRFPVHGAIRTSTAPVFRQMGSVGRPLGASKWFMPAPRDTYMVVRVVGAKVQSLEDYKDNLNPSVTVEWLGVKHHTRVLLF